MFFKKVFLFAFFLTALLFGEEKIYFRNLVVVKITENENSVSLVLKNKGSDTLFSYVSSQSLKDFTYLEKIKKGARTNITIPVKNKEDDLGLMIYFFDANGKTTCGCSRIIRHGKDS